MFSRHPDSFQPFSQTLQAHRVEKYDSRLVRRSGDDFLPQDCRNYTRHDLQPGKILKLLPKNTMHLLVKECSLRLDMAKIARNFPSSAPHLGI